MLGQFGNLTPLEREEAQDDARVRIALEIEGQRIKAETDGAAVSFMRTVVTNAARDIWRRRRPHEPLPPLLRDGGPSPAERARDRATLQCIERLAQSWSLENRLIFALKLEGTPSTAICADLDRLCGLAISVEAVDVRFSRLRAELRRLCGEDAADD